MTIHLRESVAEFRLYNHGVRDAIVAHLVRMSHRISHEVRLSRNAVDHFIYQCINKIP